MVLVVAILTLIKFVVLVCGLTCIVLGLVSCFSIVSALTDSYSVELPYLKVIVSSLLVVFGLVLLKLFSRIRWRESK